MWITKGQKLIALAPMADMTDQPFCRVCREVVGEPRHSEVQPKNPLNSEIKGSFANAQDDKTNFVIFSEMVSSEAIVRGNVKTLKMCEFVESEKPFVLQLFGASPETITKAAKIVVERFHPDGIDINMGCPVPKITGKNLAGAALMKDPERAVEIVKKLKEANLGVPVSVKTRLGWGKDNEILEFALKLENAGVDAITIHGRTKTQGYTGEANWQRIAEVKKLLKIPVLANGDIKDSEDIKKCFEITGADGVMIGRGALGNPWIFCDCVPDLSELKKTVLRHAELHLEHYGVENGLTTFRKHLLCYFKGERVKEITELKKLRNLLVKVSNLEELDNVLKEV